MMALSMGHLTQPERRKGRVNREDLLNERKFEWRKSAEKHQGSSAA